MLAVMKKGDNGSSLEVEKGENGFSLEVKKGGDGSSLKDTYEEMRKVHLNVHVQGTCMYKSIHESKIFAFFQSMLFFRRDRTLEETITNERHRPVQNTRRAECYYHRYQEKGRYL